MEIAWAGPALATPDALEINCQRERCELPTDRLEILDTTDCRNFTQLAARPFKWPPFLTSLAIVFFIPILYYIRKAKTKEFVDISSQL
jgi:hypothetical protein